MHTSMGIYLDKQIIPSYEFDFLIAQWIKNLQAVQETWVQSLGQADPLKKEKATHSNILA